MGVGAGLDGALSFTATRVVVWEAVRQPKRARATGRAVTTAVICGPRAPNGSVIWRGWPR